MIIHTELYECVQCLFQGWLSGLLIVAHRVRHSILNRILIFTPPGEVWMNPLPKVVSVRDQIAACVGWHSCNLSTLAYIGSVGTCLLHDRMHHTIHTLHY